MIALTKGSSLMFNFTVSKLIDTTNLPLGFLGKLEKFLLLSFLLQGDVLE